MAKYGLFLLILVSIFKNVSLTGSYFESISKQTISNKDYLINSRVEKNKLRCFLNCYQLSDCYFVSFCSNTGECNTFRYGAIYSLTVNLDMSFITFAKKTNFISGLIDYWPIKDQDLRDFVNGNEMVQCQNVAFAPDRFNRSNSALFLNNGYCQIKSGVYFDESDFTISVWIKPIQFGYWSRLIDFGNGPDSDNIFVAYQHSLLSIYNKTSYIYGPSLKSLNQNEWTYISTVLNSTHVVVYLNGSFVSAVKSTIRPNNMNRTQCFIGKSNWPADTYANAIFDDIKIYNRALSEEEIKTDMNFIY